MKTGRMGSLAPLNSPAALKLSWLQDLTEMEIVIVRLLDSLRGVWAGGNKPGLTAPSVCVVMNSYLGLEGSGADILAVFS